MARARMTGKKNNVYENLSLTTHLMRCEWVVLFFCLLSFYVVMPPFIFTALTLENYSEKENCALDKRILCTDWMCLCQLQMNLIWSRIGAIYPSAFIGKSKQISTSWPIFRFFLIEEIGCHHFNCILQCVKFNKSFDLLIKTKWWTFGIDLMGSGLNRIE